MGAIYQMRIDKIQNAESFEQSMDLLSKYKTYMDRIEGSHTQQDLSQYHHWKISQILNHDINNTLYIGYNDGEPVILGLLEYASEDTKIFQIPMARLEYLCTSVNGEQREQISESFVSYIIEDSKKSGFQHLTSRVTARDFHIIHTLESCGFKLMDALTILVQKSTESTSDQKTDPLTIRPYKKEDREAIDRLIGDVFSEKNKTKTRYYVDEKLPDEKCPLVYVNWFDNLEKNKDSKTFVCEFDRKIIGFASCHSDREIASFLDTKICHLVLAGVDEDYRKLGAYSSIRSALTSWALSDHDLFFSYTHPNNPVLQIAMKQGAKICDLQYTFHRWNGKL